MMKTLVFGAAGWLGRAVLANLEDHHHDIRAFDLSPEAWKVWENVDGPWNPVAGEVVHGQIVDFATVDRTMDGVDGVIHAAAYFGTGEVDENPFLVNLKGLWNVLEIAKRRGIRRVVHVGSCQAVHPEGIFFEADIRRPDASLYAVTKRLQEEMCRQFYEGTGLSIIVLRPDYIVDSRIGLGRFREKLGSEGHSTAPGWVCRHDMAEACRLALETTNIEFDVLNIAGTPEASQTCNIDRAKSVLGLELRGDLEQYR